MTFRLLDARVGWDEQALDGVSPATGALTLEALAQPVDPERIAPPQLAWMCSGCSWWLGTPDGIARLGPCDERFVPWLATGAPVVAVAARGTLLAAVVAGEGVRVFDVPGARQIGECALPGATSVSLTPAGGVCVGDRRGRLHELEPSGLRCGLVQVGAPVARLAHPPAGSCRTTVLHDDGSVSVVRRRRVRPGGLDDLGPTGVTAATALGFSVSRGTFGWDGAPLTDLGPRDSRYAAAGEYRSQALDSGIPGCGWHRIRLDADIPAGAAVQVALATTEVPGGDPHPADWFEPAAGVTDVVVRTPPGRYAYLRLRLSGDGATTPTVYQVRLDLPRRTSVDDLPEVYSEDPDAREFSERFLALFDAQLEELDDVIERRAALLDAEALPDHALGWLASLLGLGFEAEMTVAQRRALIAAAPDLYRRRGTAGGLVDTLAVAVGVEALVEELGPQRPWGAVGSAQLGAVRLFGRSRARFRLGSSTLGGAPLLARGNPDDDARAWGAHRIVVSVPYGSPRALVERVVRSQTPAHVVATVRMRAPGFVLVDPRLGIDTVLLAPAPAVVGALRLGRAGVLRRGRAGASLALIGRPLIASPNTRME